MLSYLSIIFTCEYVFAVDEYHMWVSYLKFKHKNHKKAVRGEDIVQEI